MAFDEELAERVRLALVDADPYREQRMFGGIAFMVDEHMVCGVVRGDLMVRLGREGVKQALGRPHVRPVDFTGRPMTSMAFVAPDGVRADDDLRAWVDEAMRFVATLPPKAPRRPAATRRGG